SPRREAGHSEGISCPATGQMGAAQAMRALHGCNAKDIACILGGKRSYPNHLPGAFLLPLAPASVPLWRFCLRALPIFKPGRFDPAFFCPDDGFDAVLHIIAAVRIRMTKTAPDPPARSVASGGPSGSLAVGAHHLVGEPAG